MNVSVLSVATSGYLEHWRRMFASAQEHFFPSDSLTMHLFTDEVTEAQAIRPTSSRVEIRVHEVPSWGWPDATLLRFRAICDYASEIKGEIACWLDADMLVLRSTGDELKPKAWLNGLAFVHHPGYWRPVGRHKLINWLTNPGVALGDARWLLQGRAPIGAWEFDSKSRAYVPPLERVTYICGGAWFGWTDRILQMSEVLARRTDEDLNQGVIARWHDESHVNWYLAHNSATVLGPEYCYERSYPRLSGIKPRIEALNKGVELSQVRTQQRQSLS